MTNPNITHITLLCDRSGSMESVQSDAQGAVRAFIKTQQEVPGEATLLLADFDAPWSGELEWFNVVHDGKLADAPAYVLQPRGSTALRDAFGRAITMTGERLAKIDEVDRPGKVFFVLQTDGQENASSEWTQEGINALIKEHEETWKWTFVFLACGPDAFAASHAYVGTRMASHNTVRGGPGGQSVGSTYSFAATAVASTRTGDRDVDTAYAAFVDDAGNVTEGTNDDPKKGKAKPKSKLP